MKSIKIRVIAYIGALLLAVCAGFALISYASASKALLTNVEDSLPQLAAQTAKNIESRVEGQFELLEVAAQDEVIRDTGISWSEKVPILKAEMKISGSLRMGMADKNGKLMSTDGSASDISDRDYFKQAIAGKRAISDLIVSKVDGSAVLIFAVPVKNNNETTGILICVKDGYFLCDITKDITFAKTGKAFMLNKNGATIAHSNRDLVKAMDNGFENVKNDPRLKSLVEIEKQMVEGKSGTGEYEYDGLVKYLGYAPVADTGWSIAIAAPRGEVLSGLDSLRVSMLVVALFFLLVSVAVGYIISRLIANPIITISNQLQVISTGDFTHAIPEKYIKMKDEIGTLAKSMSIMQKHIRDLVKGVIEESASVAESVMNAGKSMSGLNEQLEDVSATTEELSAGMEETAASAEEMNATSAEIEKAVDSIAVKAQEGAVSAGEISKRAGELQQSFALSHNGAVKIFVDVKGRLEKALDESKAVEKINALADAILQITSQTNLLALNAAIEAARAGEAGKGFAVVAEEIRKLAEDSKNTVNQIQSITKAVINSVENLSASSSELLTFMATDVERDYKTMLGATEEYRKDAEVVDSIVTDFSATAEELAASMQNMVKAINEITAATGEGAGGTANIAQKAVIATQKSDDIMRQATAARDSAGKLEELVLRFKV